MTAPVLLAGILQAIPDDLSAPPLDSGADAHAIFQSVLEQVHESREGDSKTDDPKSSGDPKQQKDSDPTATLVVPLPVTPPAEATRLILPFTTTFTARQEAATAPGDTDSRDTTASADDPVATEDSTTAAADSKLAPSSAATTSAPLDRPRFSLESETKTNSAPSATQPKPHAKSHATSQVKLTESAPAQTVTTPLDPSAPALPVKISTTLDQAAPPVQTSLTVDEAPDAVIASTSTVERGTFILADSRTDARADARKAAYQYHSSHEASSNAPQHQEVTDSTATITGPVPVTEAVETLRLNHTPAPLNTSRQDAPAAQSSSPVAQDYSVTSATDSQAAMPPVVEHVDETTAAPPTGTIAFAARLTPTEDTPAPDASRTSDSPSRVPTPLQSATPASAKQIAPDADLPADTHGGDSGSQPDKENRFAKPAMMPPQMHATFQDQTTATSHASPGTLSPAARMDQVQETPTPAPNSNHDITIRIPDASNDQGTAVRFVERAGEVHVSVRTGDADMAQTLRGGLHDLVNRLEDSGIRTQVWQPGTDTATSQNDSHHPFADPDGSNGRQHSSGSNSQQESRQHNRPRWVEELEDSIGNPNFKETTQLLWQA